MLLFPWFWMILAIVTAPTADAAEATQAQLEALRSRMDGITATLNRDQSELASAQAALAKVERTIGDLNLEIRETQSDIGSSRARKDGFEAEIERVGETVSVLRAQLKDIIVASYASGRAEYLKLLLNQEDPAQLGRHLAYYRYLSRHRADQIRKFEDASARLRDAKAGLENELRALGILEAAQLSRRDELADAVSERGALVAALRQGIGSKQRQLDSLKQDALRLERLLGSIDTPAGPAPDVEAGPDRRFGEMRGRLGLPLRGTISARFGQKRWDTEIPWQGIFVDAPEGTDVEAVFPGRVAYADWLRGFGLLLILDHGDGFMSLYSHNRVLFKQVGEWADAGEPIAQVGSSGGAARTGLYFELRKDGEPLNPLIWCKVEGF